MRLINVQPGGEVLEGDYLSCRQADRLKQRNTQVRSPLGAQRERFEQTVMQR